MSAFLSAELTSRSVETRRASPAFMAVFRASLMLSRSTGQPHDFKDGRADFSRQWRISPASGGFHPPAADRDQSPDSLDHSERPGALQEPIDRPERAGHRKAQDVPRTAVFERIEDQHRHHGKQAKNIEKIHQIWPLTPPAC